MTDKKKYDEEFGLDMELEEALQRFGSVTKEELEEASKERTDVVPEGEHQIALFKKEEIRKILHNGEWMFSVVDVIGALTDSDRSRKYWSDLKRQLSEKEGFDELSENIGQLPLPATDGKMRQSDVANTETLLRIIQSVPSPKAEPFKRWLAKVGYERIQEMQDPEIAIKRAIMTYQIKGYSDDWIEKRVRSIVARKELTREWAKRGVKEGQQYAMLSNIISENTFGVGVARHKRVKGLSSQNLRDHMTDLELILTMLGETSTTAITKQRDSQGLYENAEAAKAGGSIAGGARKQIEAETGQKVVSTQNYLGGNKRVADPEQLTIKGKGD
ncbi:Bro-N domain-containing protein [Sphingorhabdus sp. SMR4y]|uniref:BRO-N domain-containing protein n=1 Tax=Sphingorhabdus sp. SMR4y TaxID=2584094 RepID=UPI000B5C54D9|nr:Bro-N domain-containing protein [Sphingorhabdus sp. SMR4y]ASK87263.1 hypothetical protein SPHFLASMR4Y_00477 [Sphingorhabdus sp. SMR4y]